MWFGVRVSVSCGYVEETLQWMCCVALMDELRNVREKVVILK